MIMPSSTSLVKAAVGYTLLPGVWPRLTGMVPRFGMIAYLMAVIFQMVHLLPNGHPLLHPSQAGKYRIRDVMAAAANNLRGGFKNADQYLIFGIFLIGIVILVIQFVLVGGLIVMSTAHAAPVFFMNFFTTLKPQIDVAHLMLDRVFGIPGFFKSCFDPVASAAAGGNVAGGICEGFVPQATFPTQFQLAMQWMFKFYSMGMLAVAGFMVVYYIFAMLAETVNTGVPFGKRFQSFYTPIRLILAILLMLPLAYGYNTGQYIVLWSAKFGSAFATNSWYLFNERTGTNPLGMQPQQLIALPKVQDIESIINYFYLVQTCKAAYEVAYKDATTNTAKSIQPYLVRPANSLAPAAYMQLTAGTTFATARTFFSQGDVNIVFGEYNASYTSSPANIRPYCGIMNVPALSKTVQGIDTVYDVYFQSIMALWNNADMISYGKKMACNLKFSDKAGCKPAPTTGIAWDAPDVGAAGQGFYMNMRLQRQADYTSQMNTQLATLRTTQNPEVNMDAKLLLYGWGGAGMYFNKLVSYNGALVDAVTILPTPLQYPMIMEHIAKKKRSFEKNIAPKDMYSLSTGASGKSITLDKQAADFKGDDSGLNIEVANLLSTVYNQIQNSEATTKPRTGNTSNPVKNWISLLFGQTGLFDFRGNSDVFPLSKLAMLGREIIDKTLIMVAAGGLMTGLSGVIGGATQGPIGDAVGNLGVSMMTFATIGLTIGIVLFYIIPFMPFVYFFFAVGRWVKSIFEAMVAIPLWALAHLRLEGNGIPGSYASTGYFLILEIMLRPIFSVFGLLMALGTFMAMSAGLDSVFNLAVTNVGGFDMTTLSSGGTDPFTSVVRDGMDALFYTIVYALLVYMMATASFKLIDGLPNSVMRWAGSGAQAFNDGVNLEQQIDRYMVQESRQMVEELKGQITKTTKKTGDSVSDMINQRNNMKND